MHNGINGVCPICKERGGDPNFISSDLTGHLAYRHLKDDLYCPNPKYQEILMKKI